jgi:hypothetical protein
MIARRAPLLAAAVLAFAGTACDDITGLDEGILLENETGVSITQVFIRDCESSNWGNDRLGAEEVISPNDSREFDVGDGCFDMRAVFLTGGATEEHDVEIDEGDQFVWRIDNPSATIIVDNDATAPVHFLYFAQCTDDEWGDPELDDSETIAPGASRHFSVIAGCWDLRAEFSDASFAEDFGISLAEDEEFTWQLVD